MEKNIKEKKLANFNKQKSKFIRKKKFCKFCAQGIEVIDYKDVDTLTNYLTYNSKIASKKQTGNCSSHQRRVSNAIKRARIVALLPYMG